MQLLLHLCEAKVAMRQQVKDPIAGQLRYCPSYCPRNLGLEKSESFLAGNQLNELTGCCGGGGQKNF